MKLENATKEQVEIIIDKMTNKVIKQPIFMYYCPKLEKRHDFVQAFLKYYVYEWSEYDNLLCDEDYKALLTLINPRTYEYRFKGKGAFAMRRQKDCAERIFKHRKNVRGIVHIIAPGTMSPWVMNIYGNAATDMPAIESLVDEAIELANDTAHTLVYETFSKKYIEMFEKKGFAIAYRKAFGSTHFIQTIMVKHPNKIYKKEEQEEINQEDIEQEDTI